MGRRLIKIWKEADETHLQEKVDSKNHPEFTGTEKSKKACWYSKMKEGNIGKGAPSSNREFGKSTKRTATSLDELELKGRRFREKRIHVSLLQAPRR